MPTARSTARRSIRPTTCRSSIRRRTRCRTSRCRWPIRTCRSRSDRATPARSSRRSLRPIGATRCCGTRKANQHNAMFDEKGRVWLAATVRGMDNPAWCKKGSEHPSAKVFPLDRSPRQVGDARSEDAEVRLHRHLLRHPSSAVRLRRRQHAVALRHRPGGGLGQHQGVGRDRATRRRRSAGSRSCSTPTATASSTNSPSRASRRSGQGHALQSGLRPLRGDAASDRRLGLVHLRRVRRHARASCASIPKTKLSEFYAVPKEAIGLRGGDIGADGVLWGSGSAGHLVAFDRRKCKGPLNGPNATGNHCPEGFAAAQVSGTGLRGLPELQRRGELLHLGRSPQHGRARRRTFRSRPPTSRTASSASRTAR